MQARTISLAPYYCQMAQALATACNPWSWSWSLNCYPSRSVKQQLDSTRVTHSCAPGGQHTLHLQQLAPGARTQLQQQPPASRRGLLQRPDGGWADKMQAVAPASTVKDNTLQAGQRAARE
mmetsp:Transcript_10808/g.26620  ORF Transcript_10808/g.26620 Transcript_10808/m.26620 type:complete len:121 (+) Transcript_10808:55-417(+)